MQVCDWDLNCARFSRLKDAVQIRISGRNSFSCVYFGQDQRFIRSSFYLLVKEV